MASSSRRSDRSSRSSRRGADGRASSASSARDPEALTWYFLTTPPLWIGEEDEDEGEALRLRSETREGSGQHEPRGRSATRRNFFGVLGAGLSAAALGFAWSRPELRRPGRQPVPAGGARPLAHEDEFAAWIVSLRLRYLSPVEVIRPHRKVRGGIANELPPPRHWSRLEPTLRVADEIRHRLGRPILCVNSAYRSPAYNAVCSGAASRSYHMENRALDLVFAGGPAEAAGIAVELREEGFFRGGIGTYSSFIHIDTRGRNATWDG